MSALDHITKRDASQPRPALVTMDRSSLEAALAKIEDEFRAGDLAELDIASTARGAPAATIADRLWKELGGRDGG